MGSIVEIKNGYSAGGIITAFAAYTVSITGSSSNPAKGTTTFDQGYFRRIGDCVEIRYQYVQTGAGSAGSGTYLFSLPSVVLDTTKYTASTANQGSAFGTWIGVDGTSQFGGGVQVFDTTHVFLNGPGVGSGNTTNAGSPVGSTVIPLSNSTARYAFHAILPVSGWSPNG